MPVYAKYIYDIYTINRNVSSEIAKSDLIYSKQ